MRLKSVLLLGAFVAIVKPTSATSEGFPSSIVVTSILDAPYLSRRDSKDGPQYEGYCADLTAELARLVGFNYTLKVVADDRYGMRSADGEWNGMIGEVIRGEADIAVAPLTITSAREAVVDFSKPFMNTGISIMIKKPVASRPNCCFFLYPFTFELWLVLLITCLAIGFTLFALARYGTSEKRKQSSGDPTASAAEEEGNRFRFIKSLWYPFKTIFRQETGNAKPRSISGRVLIATWWLFVFFIVALYIGSLVAFMYEKDNTKRMLLPVTSVEDLAKQTEIKYGAVDSGSTREFFRSSTIPIYAKMWEFMSSAEPSVFVRTNSEGIARVRSSNGKYAFLMESTVNDFTNQQRPCDTMRVGQPLNSRAYGIAMRAGSPLRNPINLAVLEIIESGFLARLQQKWWYEKGECGLDNELQYDQQKTTLSTRSLTALTIRDVAGVFYLLIFGVILAFIVGLLEYVYARRKRSNRGKATETKSDAESAEKV